MNKNSFALLIAFSLSVSPLFSANESSEAYRKGNDKGIAQGALVAVAGCLAAFGIMYRSQEGYVIPEKLTHLSSSSVIQKYDPVTDKYYSETANNYTHVDNPLYKAIADPTNNAKLVTENGGKISSLDCKSMVDRISYVNTNPMVITGILCGLGAIWALGVLLFDEEEKPQNNKNYSR